MRLWYNKGMNIVFSNHALARMEQRKISEELVINAINFPDHKTKSGDTIEVFKKLKKLYIKVIYSEKSKNKITIITVVTTYLVDKIKNK